MKDKLIDQVKKLVDNPEAYIKTGKVLVNNQKNEDVNYLVKDDDAIRIIAPKKYVSRGAYKLLAAIEAFQLDFQDKVVLDIGASTGGFTQVLLEKKAKKVYALDVGTNQLDFKLRSNDKVVVMEKTNLKNIKKAMFNEKIAIVVVDISFISLKHVFNVLTAFKEIKIMALIKPQFEAFKDEVEKGGYVSEKNHDKIIKRVLSYAKKKAFHFIKKVDSPLLGKKSKNKEYLCLFIKGQNEF